VQVVADRLCPLHHLDQNGQRAALAAGYSPKGAAQTACKLLIRADVSCELARVMERKLNKLDVRGDHVLEGLRCTAFCDPAEFFEADGHTVRSIHDVPIEARHAISGFNVSKDGSVRVTLANRVEALDKLARNLGLLKPDPPPQQQVTGPVTVNSIGAERAGRRDPPGCAIQAGSAWRKEVVGGASRKDGQIDCTSSRVYTQDPFRDSRKTYASDAI
jgi:phage terminase small subunit